MSRKREAMKGEMQEDYRNAQSEWYSDISKPTISGGKPIPVGGDKGQDKQHMPKYSLHTMGHTDHPLYWVRNEYLALAGAALSIGAACGSRLIPTAHSQLLHYTVQLGYYSGWAFGVVCLLTAALWFYQVHQQPHPHYNHPTKDRPQDAGGDELVRTGIPKEFNRQTQQEIVEPPLHNFTLLKLIYAPHKNPYIDKFFEYVAFGVSYFIPVYAQILAKLWTERWYSRYAVKSFCKKFGIDLSDFIVPEGGYKTFQQFFTREVKKERRPIASPGDQSVLSAPADCRILVFENVEEIAEMSFKGEHMNLRRMVGDELADQWSSPSELSMILCRPGIEDYHRFHMPMDGRLTYMRTVDFRQQAIAGEGSMLGFTELPYSHRKILKFENAPVGDFLYIPFGATIVNSIVIKFGLDTALKRGDELGYFRYGSNVIFLFKRGTVEFDQDIIDNTRLHTETKVIMGTKIGKILKKSSERK